MGDVVFEFDFRLDPKNVSWMWHGNYEPEVCLAIRKFLPRGGTFVDVGANMGYVSAVALDALGTEGVVHAFEPFSEMADRLDLLASLNPKHHIEVHRFALGETDSVAQLSIPGDNIGSMTLVPDLLDEDRVVKVTKVRMKAFDRYAAEIGLEDIDMIKIDCEGYELGVLRGMKETIQRYRPAIICEITPSALPLLGQRLEDLDTLLRDAEYAPQSLISGKRVDIVAMPHQETILLQPRPRR